MLTDAGRAKLEAGVVLARRGAWRELFGERFSDEELATLAELLGRLPGAAGDGDDCTPGHA